MQEEINANRESAGDKKAKLNAAIALVLGQKLGQGLGGKAGYGLAIVPEDCIDAILPLVERRDITTIPMFFGMFMMTREQVERALAVA